ncbi:MAG: hypothetical protein ACK5N8_01880 [Alphaproteobacteria bacterium]
MPKTVLKERISSLKSEKIFSEKEIYAEDQKMLELLRVDTLIHGMRLFEDKTKEKNEAEIDASLKAFIWAYRGSAVLVYGDENDKPFENLLKGIKEQVKIKEDLSKDEIKQIYEVFPELKSQIEKIALSSKQIRDDENKLVELGGNKTASSKGKEGVDKEAQDILAKLNEKYKDKYKGYKISNLSLAGEMAALTLNHPKKGNIVMYPNLASLKPLNSVEGIERLNEALSQKTADTKKKEVIKENNKALKEKQAELLKKIEKEKANYQNLTKNLSANVEGKIRNTDDIAFLESFYEKNNSLKTLMDSVGNKQKLKQSLITSFRDEKKIWQYVREFDYYGKTKQVVRAGVDKQSPYYLAISPELKDLIEIREIELAGLKDPVAGSYEKMNEDLKEFNSKIRLQRIAVDSSEKTGEFAGKTPSQVSDILLGKATEKAEDGLSPYQKRYMTVGLMYALGEGFGKNDEAQLFRHYMKIYFGKERFSVAEIPALQKDYAWNEFKQLNVEQASAIYKDISKNAQNPNELKQALLEGSWTATNENSVHHILPRRYAACLKDPNEINNQTNLAVTAHWKAWEVDGHQIEHFYNMSPYEGVGHFLTQKNGEFTREEFSKNLSEVYYEKPQDAKGSDLIPENSLYVSSNIVVAAPEVSDKVKHLLLDSFKSIESTKHQGVLQMEQTYSRQKMRA